MISLLKYVLNCMRRMSKEIDTVADFLKQVLPPTTTSSSAQRDASHSDTLTEHDPPVKPEPPPPRAIPTKRRRLAYKTTPIPSTFRDVNYEMPTSHLPLSIKRDVDDDVSTDDQQIEREVLYFGAMTGRIS